MALQGRITEYQRATERLYGILSGIAIDYKLNDQEIAALYQWLNTHEYLHHVEPFKSAVCMIKRSLEDQVIDPDEREEILEWCLEFSDHLPDCARDAIRRLHGVLHGIAVDHQITDMEIYSLQDWLVDYQAFENYWPFNDTWKLIKQILADGKITDQEKKDLHDYCNQFVEISIQDLEFSDHAIYRKPWMHASASPVQPFDQLCDRNCRIVFDGKSFCFTGIARYGSRRDISGLAQRLGGAVLNHVNAKLDYLVIGAQSSPCWTYSTYGRKIEGVMEFRAKYDCPITMLHEDDFTSQALRQLDVG